MSKPTYASVTQEQCSCQYLEHAANDPQSPIVFDESLNEYHFEYLSPCSDGSCEASTASIVIYHCPFCGGTAPASKREQLFTVVRQEELRRLLRIFEGIKTLEDAIRIIGEPDQDAPYGDAIHCSEYGGKAPKWESYRTLTYCGLSKTADVILTDFRAMGLDVSIQGKYIGLPSALTKSRR